MIFAPASSPLVPWMQPQFGRGRFSGGVNPIRSGLALELIADNIPSGNVAIWTDTSMSGNDATQSNPGLQPVCFTGVINGHSVVRADGVTDTMFLTSDITGDVTVFVVQNPNSSGGTYQPYIIGGFGRLCQQLSSADWGTFCGGDLSAGEALSGVSIIEMSSSASSCIIYRDGVFKNSVSAQSTGNGAGFTQLFAENGAARNLAGDVAELLVYSVILNTADRHSVEGYLSSKYAI